MNTAQHEFGAEGTASHPLQRRNPPNEYLHLNGLRLGRLPRKSDTRALLLNRFAALDTKPPVRTRFWEPRSGFPLRIFGNDRYGCCTRASQAQEAMRFERIEQRRTVEITDDEVIRVYTEMSDRLYGGGDNGAFETDALDCWRRPEYTFKDTKGRALTIDSYLRINVSDLDELRRAIALSGAHGIKLCFNLPWAWANVSPPADWDVAPGGAPLTGDYLPGSWGGHSMYARDYDEVGPWVVHTWGIPDQRVTWAAVAAYCDETHLVIDSFDYWRTKKPAAIKGLDLAGIRAAVNKISSRKIA